ncbi:hypothetical protein HMPREF9980_06657 [Staphylococcus epidermidis NIHLM031]|nr:hypothetical protein HMPREF9980_06657 [Staphylococcus epidermidis NIHLM031]
MLYLSYLSLQLIIDVWDNVPEESFENDFEFVYQHW